MTTQCDVCGKWFTNDLQLAQHTQFFHRIPLDSLERESGESERERENKIDNIDSDSPIVNDLKEQYEILKIQKQIDDLRREDSQRLSEEQKIRSDEMKKSTQDFCFKVKMEGLENKIEELKKQIKNDEWILENHEDADDYDYWCDVVDRDQEQLDDFNTQLEELKK